MANISGLHTIAIWKHSLLFLRYLIYATQVPLCYHYGNHYKLAAIIAHRIHPQAEPFQEGDIHKFFFTVTRVSQLGNFSQNSMFIMIASRMKIFSLIYFDISYLQAIYWRLLRRRRSGDCSQHSQSPSARDYRHPNVSTVSGWPRPAAGSSPILQLKNLQKK